MAPGLGFFGAKRWAEAVDLPEGERPRLGIELSALGQIRLALAEVVELEQVAGAFARGRCQNRRIEEHEPALVKEVAAGLNHLAADSQDRVLARRAHPEVALVQQKRDAVFLGCYRIVAGGRDLAHVL